MLAMSFAFLIAGQGSARHEVASTPQNKRRIQPRSNCITCCGAWLAWAIMAVPAC
jgi:hypothetical protein